MKKKKRKILLCCTAQLPWLVLQLLELYCTVLHCIAVMHCNPIYCIVIHCTALMWSVLHCTTRYCTILYDSALYCSLLFSTRGTSTAGEVREVRWGKGWAFLWNPILWGFRQEIWSFLLCTALHQTSLLALHWHLRLLIVIYTKGRFKVKSGGMKAA